MQAIAPGNSTDPQEGHSVGASDVAVDPPDAAGRAIAG
jgi:hypothetical protein